MTQVALTHEGNYFGEMSLLKGEVSGDSIIAITESIIIKIEHEGMAKLFTQCPELIDK